MDLDWVREYCLALPHTTEKVQWEDNLVFKIGGKMYAVVALEPGDPWLGFKCTPENFVALVERPGIIPAPYLARAHWVSLETSDALSRIEVEHLLSQAYSLIFAKLPKTMQLRLGAPRPPPKSQKISARRKSARNTPQRDRSSRRSSPRTTSGKGR
jgi:predicted DNA-binding protein (MmcQ/YjbR family)